MEQGIGCSKQEGDVGVEDDRNGTTYSETGSRKGRLENRNENDKGDGPRKKKVMKFSDYIKVQCPEPSIQGTNLSGRG